MEYLKIRNWSKWQTYRTDRGQPPWIKIHRCVMRDPEWVSLSDAERGQLVAIWLLAADNDGKVPASASVIQKLCFMSKEPNLNKFTDLQFIENDWRHAGVTLASTGSQRDATEKSRVDKNRVEENNYTPSKNKKIKFLDCVYLDEIERDKLIKDYTLHGFNKIVQIINDYKMANGKKYKSDYHAIKNWVIDRYRKENKINGIQGNDNGDDNIFLKPLGEEDRPEPDKSVYPDT